MSLSTGEDTREDIPTLIESASQLGKVKYWTDLIESLYIKTAPDGASAASKTFNPTAVENVLRAVKEAFVQLGKGEVHKDDRAFVEIGARNIIRPIISNRGAFSSEIWKDIDKQFAEAEEEYLRTTWAEELELDTLRRLSKK